jgi:hypothetical protein
MTPVEFQLRASVLGGPAGVGRKFWIGAKVPILIAERCAQLLKLPIPVSANPERHLESITVTDHKALTNKDRDSRGRSCTVRGMKIVSIIDRYRHPFQKVLRAEYPTVVRGHRIAELLIRSADSHGAPIKEHAKNSGDKDEG